MRSGIVGAPLCWETLPGSVNESCGLPRGHWGDVQTWERNQRKQLKAGKQREKIPLGLSQTSRTKQGGSLGWISPALGSQASLLIWHAFSNPKRGAFPCFASIPPLPHLCYMEGLWPPSCVIHIHVCQHTRTHTHTYR